MANLRLGERFIPACAGNTPCQWAQPTPRTVHPRVCGEHEMDTVKADASPLGTRGPILTDSNLPSPKEVPDGLRAG